MLSARAIGLACLIPFVAHAEFRWDIPDPIQVVEVPEIVRANGHDVRLAAAVSKRRPQEVAQFYMDLFQRAGLYVAWPESQRSSTIYPQLTGLDTEHLVSYTVILQPNADGTTTIVFGTTDLSKPTLAQKDDFLPLFPGAKGAFRTSTEGMRTITYSVSASGDEVADYYREVLGAEGYVEKPEGTFVRDDVRIRLLTAASPGGTRVLLTRTNGDPLDEPGVSAVEPEPADSVER
ncbi:MAG: hypothetical protein IRZ16_01815 [Myxococcaceae bacterium]|nr:hypothetical protein [Myxococcaceae bacterium]